jgi:probable rRNA maturation factor
VTVPKSSLLVRNHQRANPVNLPLLRRMLRFLLEDLLDRRHFDLGIHLVGSAEITRLNESFLGHRGVTDVIAFDYSQTSVKALHGEVFVCLPVALEQARRFRSSWQQEVVRYVVHGVLHLCGYDDCTPARRREMKRAENAVMRRLAARFSFTELRVLRKRGGRKTE